MNESNNSKRTSVSVQFDDLDLTGYALGENEDLIQFDRIDQQQALLGRMLDHASSSIVLLGDRINTRLWGDAHVVAALRGCLRRNPGISMQILVHNSRELVQSGHQLAELLRGFMPAVSCRLRRSQPHSFEASCIVVDKIGYLYIPNVERNIGSASFRDVATATKLLDVFAQEWQVAQPDPELKPLYI